ncbi:MAG TPA: hypothetical protein VD978_27350 [Azospirillum sp.]|nr:hypothetical protein [Azospirillum sp.]
MNKNLTRLVLLGAMLAMAVPLAGCNEEGERPLHFEKGKYTGPSDSPLSQQQLDTLKQRLNNGRF